MPVTSRSQSAARNNNNNNSTAGDTQVTRSPTPEPVNANMEALTALIQNMADQINDMTGQMQNMTGRMDRLADEVNGIKTDLAVVKTDLAVVKGDIAGVKAQVEEADRAERERHHRQVTPANQMGNPSLLTPQKTAQTRQRFHDVLGSSSTSQPPQVRQGQIPSQQPPQGPPLAPGQGMGTTTSTAPGTGAPADLRNERDWAHHNTGPILPQGAALSASSRQVLKASTGT
jgi:archaellum component FlaC